jgi:hypothetical protein
MGFFLEQFRDNAHQAVTIVEGLKKLLDTNIPDIITMLIPGSKDDMLVAYLRDIVPPILEKTIIALNIVKSNNQKSKIIEKGLEYLKGATKDQKALFYTTFAAELNIALSDGKISFGEAIILSQLVYREIKNSKK